MVAAHHREQPPRVGEFTFFDVLYPGAIDANRHLMLALARHGAGMAADAFAIVDQKAKARHFFAPADGQQNDARDLLLRSPWMALGNAEKTSADVGL